MGKSHTSVLLDEVVSGLSVVPRGVYVDCTFGAGGYSRAILSSAPDTKVLAIDRDQHSIEFAIALQKEYKDRLFMVQDKFSNLSDIVERSEFRDISGIVCDLGVSSMQLDNAKRGFSFSKEGELSMQMGSDSLTARDVVNSYSEEDIANIIYDYGEERASRRIAKAIVAARKLKPIETTVELADIVCKVVSSKKIHPATRTFQAIRIYVNDELGELEKMLQSSLDLLSSGGRICMVSFHSLEDRIIKQFFNRYAGKVSRTSRYIPEVGPSAPPQLRLINNRPITPGDSEVAFNPRSRSAKLRIAERISG